MKKFISLLLTALMLFGLAVPSFALEVGTETVDIHESKSQVPVIRILGDGEPLYDSEGNVLFSLRTAMSGSVSLNSDNSELYKSVANVLLPFLIDGMLNDEWDAYYENLQKEISDITGDAKLDCNGNPVEGTGLSQTRQEYMKTAATTDQKGSKGYYAINDYRFWYDWRLDPFETAAKLNEYIKSIKTVTGCDKVAIMSSCIGTIITTTYISVYGTDDLHGVGFTGSVAGGAEVLSEIISGKFDVNSGSIERILMDSAYLGIFDFDSFINASLELLLASGVVDMLEAGIRDTLYDKLVQGVTSALALSTFYTYPTYWAMISEDDYEDALYHIFGEEGSEKREEYAGLIKKIEKYDSEIRNNFTSIIKSIGENGVNFGAVSKYGFQILPICQSYDALSDQFVSVNKSSFGATTSTIYTTLGDEYISQAKLQSADKYISPDKQIDASTCLYPDSTWFIKNCSHSDYTTYERKLLYEVITADRQLTTEDFPWSQFIVYDYETGVAQAMTEGNCNTEQWVADEKSDNLSNRGGFIIKFITKLLNWFSQLIQRFFK